MMTTRRRFAVGLCAALAAINTIASTKTFNELLRDEVSSVLKKHAHEIANEPTCRFIEAEIDDWAHMHVVSGELDAFHVQCDLHNKEIGKRCWVQCTFKLHHNGMIFVLECEAPT